MKIILTDGAGTVRGQWELPKQMMRMVDEAGALMNLGDGASLLIEDDHGEPVLQFTAEK